MQIYFGVVENRSDPLELGRCQVRVVGLHTHDKNLLPTADLPWCATMQPSTSAAMNGIGFSFVGPVEGTSVVVTFMDDSQQQGLILGSVGGIATEPVPIDFDDSGPILGGSTDSSVSLRTVAGPTTGNKLKFYDPNANRTDLTSKLTANMLVSGYGIKEGTTIISIDSGTEITISTTVKDFGENIIDFNPPRENYQAVAASRTATAVATASEAAAEKVEPSSTNLAIPTIPPPEFKSTFTKASEGIKALIAACDKVGLTTREQKCAILGIAGGECGWVPKNENHHYSSKERLMRLFSFLTDAEAERLYNAKVKGITPQEFFSVIYGTTKRGKMFLGNRNDADGGLYFGRGFIGFTGRENYEKVQKDLKSIGIEIDCVNNPDSVNNDINIGALAAVMYIKRRVPKDVNPNAHPAYFYAAKDAVGVNVPDIAKRKKDYYEYFYGAAASATPQKDAGVQIPTPNNTDDISKTVDINNPGPSVESIKSGSFGIGFRDPNNKYPLKDYIGESDINRLARGVIEGTIVKDKDSKRVSSVPIAGGGTWAQPEAPYGSKYPFNKVIETESGHVQEWDDTPGFERTNSYHRSGTFTEVDCNGTQVNYIVGDNFILMENNGCIHVAGACNITVDGNTNIFARSDANVQVSGNTNIECGKNLNVGVASEAIFKVGGNFEIKAGGQFKVTADAGMELVTGGSLAVQSEQATSLKAGDIFVESDVGIAAKAAKTIAAHAGENIGMKAGKKLYATAGSDLNIKAGAAVKLDGSMFLQQSGAAGSAASVAGVGAIEGLDYSAPALGDPLYKNPPFLIPPERQFEERTVIETPEDWNTPEGRSESNALATNASIPGASTAVVAEEAGGQLSGGIKAAVAVDKSLIETTKDFTSDYRMSKNFNLGMMIAGGVGGPHKLQAQMLSYKGSAERLFTVQEIVGNMAETANNILEKIVDVLPGGIGGYNKQWNISSGYRLKGVEKRESATSDHCKGHCVDIVLKLPDKHTKTYELIQQIEKLIPYDQLLLEYRSPQSVWMHMSYRKDNNRRQAFTMVNDSKYKDGFHLVTNIPPPPPKKG